MDISHKKFILLKSFDSEFSCIKVWFTDQNPEPIEIEDETDITLVLNWNVKYKKQEMMSCSVQTSGRTFMDFSVLLKMLIKILVTM